MSGPHECAHALYTSMMSFLDNVDYKMLGDSQFFNNQLLQITNLNVNWWFCMKAYGTPELEIPQGGYLPLHTLKTPDLGQDSEKEGNPSKSQAVNDCMEQVEKNKVKGVGLKTNTCHPIKWDKFIIVLLIAAQTFFPVPRKRWHWCLP